MRALLLALLLLLAGCTEPDPADPPGAGDAAGDIEHDPMAGDDAAGDEPVAEDPECPGHWHTAATFFVHDQRVRFTDNPPYTLEGGTMPLRTHMHRGSESIWHFEPTRTECIPLREALATVDVRLEPGLLKLSGNYHAQEGWGGEHREDGGELVRAWLRPHGGEWEPVEVEALTAGQVQDGVQVLVAFGDHDADDVARMQDEATEVPAHFLPRD